MNQTPKDKFELWLQDKNERFIAWGPIPFVLGLVVILLLLCLLFAI